MYSVILLTLLSLLYPIHTYNILGFSFIPVRSHDLVITSLLKELSRREHQVTVYTVLPGHENLPNYKEVDIRSCFSFSQAYQDIPHMNKATVLSAFSRWYNNVKQFFNPENCEIFQNLFNSTEKFDVLVFEPFHMNSIVSVAEFFDIPVVYIFANVLFPWTAANFGTPANPSYIPTIISRFGPNMEFLERVQNSFWYVMYMVFYEIWLYPLCDEIGKTMYPDSRPLNEAERRASVILTNTHHSLYPNIPLAPNVIQVGGITVKSLSGLPKNIEKFINESQHGVVYFCMGSLLRGETFPEEKRNAFLYAFSKIPQRVLWKWEGEVLPGKSDNIMISKWMPQRDILAHPNVKLFISHGGLLGTSEAVYEGVPVLGIPIFGDQRTNIKSLEANGAGELLDYNEITKDVVLEKIQRLLNDPKYKENAKQLSARYRDRPMSPLDTAVYWTEYVIRHKGAPHLRTAAADMPWYQYLLLDVIAFLILVTVSALAILYYSIKLTLRFLCNLICGKKSSSKPATGKKVKRN